MCLDIFLPYNRISYIFHLNTSCLESECFDTMPAVPSFIRNLPLSHFFRVTCSATNPPLTKAAYFPFATDHHNAELPKHYMWMEMEFDMHDGTMMDCPIILSNGLIPGMMWWWNAWEFSRFKTPDPKFPSPLRNDYHLRFLRKKIDAFNLECSWSALLRHH